MEYGSKRKINIPKDIRIAWERNFSFLGTFLIGKQHINDLKNKVGAGFKQCAFFHSDGQVKFYRSESEEADFCKKIWNRCLKEKDFVDYLINNLKEYSDKIKDFLKNEKKFSAGNIEFFISLMDIHFPFHLALFWAADAMEELSDKNKFHDLRNKFHEARKYNEMVLPQVEKWLFKNNSAYLNFTPDECQTFFFNGAGPSKKELSTRNNAAFVEFNSSGPAIYSRASAKKMEKKYDNAFLSRFDAMDHKLQGNSTYKGIYQGKARIVLDFQDFKKIKKDEVLVTPMTIPAYYQYIRKAGAIVTDEGAILSHAAILSREFKIPCIIGTKIATKVLKDGQLVEVDANKGVVRILKK
ncbi:MAG: PEP-utilizing enzyme [Patescibacteria group bacterium]